MDVFDIHGDKVGSVDEISGGDPGYMKVKSGLLGLGGSWRISLDAVREIRSDGIHLSVGKEEADRSGSNVPPRTAGEADRVETTPETTRGGESGGRIELREEELRARKETVEAGEVRVRKDVVTEQRTVDVPVTHEEAVVERHPVAPRPAGGEIREGEELRVPLREEQVQVEKQAMVTEEVNVGKQPVQETKQVSGTVRREKLRVESEGDVDVRGDEPPRKRK